MRENRLRLSGHAHGQQPIDTTVKRINWLEVRGTSRTKGRPKKTWTETVRKDLKALNSTDTITLEWTE